MVKKSNGKRKGIPRGAQKGFLVSKSDSPNALFKTLKKWLPLRRLRQLATIEYNYLMRVCIFLRVVPMERTGHDEIFVLPSRFKLYQFYLYRLITGLLMLYRVWVAITGCLYEEVDTSILLALVVALAYFDVWIISPWDISNNVDAYASRFKILLYYRALSSTDRSVFDNIGICIKVLGTISMVPITILCIGAVNGLLFGSLPTSWLRLVMKSGLIDVDKVTIWWQLLFFPLEIISLLGPVITAALICCGVFLGLDQLRVLGEEIRKAKVTDLESYMKVREMYICWQILSNLIRSWAKVHIVPLILGISCGVIVSVFVTIRYTSLPILIYALFPLLGVTCLVLLAIGLYEAVVITQISQRVLGEQLMTSNNFEDLQIWEVWVKKEMKKRLKSLRPVSMPLGSFTEVQYSVMAAIWEEIVNQILFLLSL